MHYHHCYLIYVIRKVKETDDRVQLNGRHKVIGYDDALALLEERNQKLSAMTATLEDAALRVGLKVSREKNRISHMKRYKDPNQKQNNLAVTQTIYKSVDKFKYLGCTVTDTNRREDEIDIRIQNALRCSAAVHKILVSKTIARKTKINVNKTIIRPILMYGCESWTLSLKEENKLLVAERKVLRKILGPKRQIDESWRVRKNREMEELVAEPNIIGKYKAARLRWFGHLERMEEDRADKRVYVGRPHQLMRKRPVGRLYTSVNELFKDHDALK
ncbi:putative transposon-derived protein F52C9.6 [Aphomia sociella]